MILWKANVTQILESQRWMKGKQMHSSFTKPSNIHPTQNQECCLCKWSWDLYLWYWGEQQFRKGKLIGPQKIIMPFRNRIEFNRQTQFLECIDYPFQSKGVEFKNKSSNKRDTGHASLREQPVWSHREWDLDCTHILYSRIHPCPPQITDKT